MIAARRDHRKTDSFKHRRRKENMRRSQDIARRQKKEARRNRPGKGGSALAVAQAWIDALMRRGTRTEGSDEREPATVA